MRVFVFVSCVCCVAMAALDADQELAVQDVFRHFLKLQPPRGVGGVGVGVGDALRPPKHMLELYERYSHAGAMKKTSGNTVRSILPTLQGSTPASELLVFNVTCVDQSEEVNLAQLHLHRRRLPRPSAPNRHNRFLAPPFRVRLYQVLKHRSRALELASLPVAQHTRGGWHSLDITAVLRELLLSTPVASLHLGVRFEAPKNRPISPDKFLKATDETSAFLVVFSDDNSLVSEEVHARNPVRHAARPPGMVAVNRTNDDFYLEVEQGVDVTTNSNSYESFEKKTKSILEKKRISDDDDDDLNGVELDSALNKKHLSLETSGHKMKERRMHPKSRYRVRPWPSLNDVADADADMTSRRRAARSVNDNELPDIVRDGGVPKSSPQSLLKTRESQLIPLPGGSTRRWRGGGVKRRRGRGKKRQNKKRGKGWQNTEQTSDEWHNSAKLERDDTYTCHRNKLVVDFADIGWADWIKSPHKFEAHYCTGKCVYPLTKALKPTNHAAIQSLVHAIGRQPEVPDPCCVPDKLGPMSLLYLDENLNVVLRSYRDMTVESCACR